MVAIAARSIGLRRAARPTTLACVLAFGASGCDPGWNATGHLIDALGAPVGGAKLTLVSPSGLDAIEFADPAGGIHLGSVGSAVELPKSTLKIEKPGYVTRTIPTLDLCYRSTEAGNLAIACRSGEGMVIISKDPSYRAPPGDAGLGGD